MNVPKLRFPGFVGEWEALKIENVVLKISSGISKIRSECGKYPYYGSTGIIDYTDTADYSGDKILIARVGANAGTLYKVNGNYSVSDNTLVVELDETINFNFVYFFFNFFNLNRLVFGSGQPLITSGHLKNIEFYLPSLEEQQKIATFLSSVDNVIQLMTKKKTLLEDYKKGIVQKIFSQEIRFKDEDGNDFPDWEEKRLGEVALIIMGQSPDSKSYNEDGIGLVLIQGNADIANRTTISRIWTSEPTKLCKIGDVLLTVRAPVGEVAISAHEACIGRGVCALRSSEQNIIQYLYQFLLSYEGKWDSLSQGSTFTAVNSSDIKQLTIPVPSLPEQQKIADFLSGIDRTIEIVNSQIEKTKEYKKGLLQQMFV